MPAVSDELGPDGRGDPLGAPGGYGRGDRYAGDDRADAPYGHGPGADGRTQGYEDGPAGYGYGQGPSGPQQAYAPSGPQPSYGPGGDGSGAGHPGPGYDQNSGPQYGGAPDGYADRGPDGYYDQGPEGYADRGPGGYPDQGPEGYGDRGPNGYYDQGPDGYDDGDRDQPHGRPEPRGRRGRSGRDPVADEFPGFDDRPPGDAAGDHYPGYDGVDVDYWPETAPGAMATLWLGIVGLVPLIGLFTAIAALITGGKARRAIRASNGELEGLNLVKIGTVLAWVGIALFLVEAVAGVFTLL
jgi:hypothetical protein